MKMKKRLRELEVNVQRLMDEVECAFDDIDIVQGQIEPARSAFKALRKDTKENAEENLRLKDLLDRARADHQRDIDIIDALRDRNAVLSKQLAEATDSDE